MVRPPLFAVLVGLTLISTTGGAQDTTSKSGQSGEVETALEQTSMGPVCWAAIVEATVQIAERCSMDVRQDTIQELNKAGEALGRKFIESGWTLEYLEGFRRQMGEADVATEDLCAKADAVQFAEAVAGSSPEYVKATTEQMLARPGPPEWGTCL
ncbi:MAG: hypothetical protein AAF687_13020 [Pseudomonadota bacterium]